jgi:hypothetical protein
VGYVCAHRRRVVAAFVLAAECHFRRRVHYGDFQAKVTSALLSLISLVTWRGRSEAESEVAREHVSVTTAMHGAG